VTRSPSVVFYCIDPSRSAAVPGAHFAGLQAQRAIIVCDRCSAYKKLTRLALNILLAFCWAPMRRDFLDAGRAFAELQERALEWKERIGTLYHLNQLRLEQWDPERPIGEQCAGFHQHHAALLGWMQWGGCRTCTRRQLGSWRGENSIRTPVTGRKNYLGYATLPGAQLRYTVYSAGQPIALLGFGAAAWMCAPRDRYIGWSHEQRRRHLHLVVNNARFLILPWIQAHNLASMLLAKAAKLLPRHWQDVYAYRPVLLETCVERPRFRGTC
jgi:hypothetical protein